MIDLSPVKISKLPQYMVLANDIIHKIHGGILRPGTKLSSVRELARLYGVGERVAYWAVNYLSVRDYVYTEPKRGVFINPAIKPNRYYRILYYVHDANPAGYGESLNVLNRLCREKASSELFLFSNFITGVSLKKYLAENPLFDGIFIDGHVNNKLLSELLPFQIPFIVLGNYDILSDIPQQSVCLVEETANIFTPVLKAFQGKTFVAILGQKSSSADREIGDGLAHAAKRVGIRFLSKHCESDGYAESYELLRSSPPDVLFLLGSQVSGFRKLKRLHPELVLPYTITLVSHATDTLRNLFDVVVEKDFFGESELTKAAEKLFFMIENPSTIARCGV